MYALGAIWFQVLKSRRAMVVAQPRLLSTMGFARASLVEPEVGPRMPHSHCFEPLFVGGQIGVGSGWQILNI